MGIKDFYRNSPLSKEGRDKKTLEKKVEQAFLIIGRIDEKRPNPDLLKNLSPEILNACMQSEQGSEYQRQKILKIVSGNQELAEKFPEVDYEKKVKYNPVSAAILEKNIAPLSESEIDKTNELVLSSIATGQMPVFPAAHRFEVPHFEIDPEKIGEGLPQEEARKDQALFAQILEKDSLKRPFFWKKTRSGEGPVYLTKFVPGWKTIQARFGEETLRRLLQTSVGIFNYDENIFSSRGMRASLRQDDKYGPDQSAMHKYTGVSFAIDINDVYFPESSGSKIAQDPKDRSIKRYRTTTLQPIKCLQIEIATHLGVDPRISRNTIRIFLGASEKLNESLNLAPDAQPAGSYARILRAVQTDPESLIRALQQRYPELFKGSGASPSRPKGKDFAVPAKGDKAEVFCAELDTLDFIKRINALFNICQQAIENQKGKNEKNAEAMYIQSQIISQKIDLNELKNSANQFRKNGFRHLNEKEFSNILNLCDYLSDRLAQNVQVKKEIQVAVNDIVYHLKRSPESAAKLNSFRK